MLFEKTNEKHENKVSQNYQTSWAKNKRLKMLTNIIHNNQSCSELSQSSWQLHYLIILLLMLLLILNT